MKDHQRATEDYKQRLAHAD